MPTHQKKTNAKVRSAVKAPPSPLLGILRAAVISLGCGIAVLFLLCAVLLTTEDPGTYAPLAAALIPLPISFVCGILSAKQSTLGGLLSGILGGTVLCLMLCILGFALPRGGVTVTSPLRFPIRAGLCLALSAIGGYTVTHSKPKTHRPHRHP